ncbi:MAG: ice-binding family protein, partial [Gallionella sp.]|nr:ice-binding family protein [Gallionella sp.]
MNRSASISKPLLWCTAILLASAASTLTAQAAGPAPVVLGTAGNFAILAKSGISTVPASAVTGDIGVSPISQTAITGFSQTLDASN